MLDRVLPAFCSVLDPETNGTAPLLLVTSLVAPALALALAGILNPGTPERRVKAGRRSDGEGIPRAFTLSLGDDTVTLDGGKSWVQVDRYKWVTRGLIEPPQSFHVLRDGTVEINGEKILLSDPQALAKLEAEINKHHPEVVAHKTSPAASAPPAGAPLHPETHSPGKVRFHVKLDHFGHLMIVSFSGAEKVETGLRGIAGLVQNGLMLKPGHIHLDPLQRGIEMDGVRFDASEAGARQLEEALNSRYAPTLKVEQEGVVEIRENPASPTGFDIHFMTTLAGARFDVKGHLTQEQLEVLQNSARCNLLHQGIVLRLSPPHLLVRRKRPDGGEERLADLPDINYLRSTARQLQDFLNHPSVHKSGKSPAPPPGASESHPAEHRESAPRPSTTPAPAAADLVGAPPKSEVQREVPAPAAATASGAPGSRPQSAAASRPAAAKAPGPEAPGGPPVDASVVALFSEADPLRVNEQVFRRLTGRFGVPAQDLLLSLPRVFEDRRFEIISFGEEEIGSVLDLRSEAFYGFYLTHIGERRIDFVYACRGTHIEWGADKCVLQPTADAEAVEFKGGALLGMAQTSDHQFVFVVTPAYRQWVRPHESRCRDAYAHFRTVNDLAAEPDGYTFIWPERIAAGVAGNEAGTG